MRKAIIFLLISTLMPIASFAEKVLTGITDEDGVEVKIEYNQQGRVQKLSGGEGEDFTGMVADWSMLSDGKVTLTMMTEDGSLPLYITVDDKGRALKVTDSFSGMNFYEFSYDNSNNLIGVKENLGDYVSEKTLIWENGNVVKVNGVEAYEGEEGIGMSVDVQYTDATHPSPLLNKGGVIGSTNVFYCGLDEMGLLSFLQFMNLVGNGVKNLPFYAVIYYATSSSYDFSFDYVLDSDGYPVEVIEKENDETLHNYYTWGEIELGIEDAVSGERKPVGVYDINGVKLSEYRKGINIVRYSDGSCEKVVVK